MKIVKYDKLIDFINVAVKMQQEVMQTDVSYSFRTYLENRNTDELHIYYYSL